MWWSLIPMLLSAGLGYAQQQQQRKAQKKYMDRYNQLLMNPNSMYANEGNWWQRRNRMNDLQSRQLAATGGTRGGAYARQLMRESAAIDNQLRQQELGNYANALGTTSGATTPAGNAYGQAQNVLNDASFMYFMNQMNRPSTGAPSMVAPAFTTPDYGQTSVDGILKPYSLS